MKYPEIVTKLTTVCDGWLVGSSADPTNDNPRDYDIYIPMNNWINASILMPKNVTVNSLGGFKFKVDNIEIDIWTGDINLFLATNYFKYAYHPRTGVRIKRC
jgi:hypothetical protein